MAGYIGGIQIDSGDQQLIGSTLYGTCTIAAGTAAKVVTLSSFNIPLLGVTVHVKFTAGNTVTSGATLKVGSTDAWNITGNFVCNADDIVSFTLDHVGDTYYWRANTNIVTAEGTTNGTIKINGQTVTVHGLGSAAYTASSEYATAAQGTLATNAMPKSGGTFTGNVDFNGGILTVPTVQTTSAGSVAASKDYVDTKFSTALDTATSAMVFQGTIGPTGATETSLPGNGYKKGWTYRVVGSYTFGTSPNEQVCEDGDVIIAIADGPATGNSITASHWTVAQANVDGAVISEGGTAGSLAKFGGSGTSHTLVDGPAFTTNGTGFLKQDGSWATPTNDRDPGYGQITISAKSTAATGLTEPSTAVTLSAIGYNELLKITSGNKWITITGTNSNNANSDEIKFGHKLSGATAASYGDSNAQTPGYGETFKVPYITIDAAGHVTSISEHNVTIPASDNIDTKVTQAYSTSNNTYPLLLSAESGISSTNSRGDKTAIVNNSIYANPSTGTLYATAFSGALSASSVKTALNTGTSSALTFLHKSGDWKTLSISNTATTIASISNGVLILTSSVNNNPALTMADPS